MVLKQTASTIALVLVSSIAIAQQPPDAVRVRGTIESKDHQVLDVKARSGENVNRQSVAERHQTRFLCRHYSNAAA